jgi:transposase, IS5 family
MKITTRCGPTAVEGLNRALLTKANAARLIKTNRVRADTTVVEANVAYPTDSGLLARGVARMAKTIKQIKAAGLAVRTATRDRTRAVRHRARDIAANLRRRTDAAKDEVRAINQDLIGIAERALSEARAVVRNAQRSLARSGRAVSGRVRAAVDALEITADRIERIAAQTRLRIAGVTPDGATRLVSLHDPDARPIAKGRLGKPVEFGYKAQVVDNDDGIVVDHNVETGNPADAPMLAPAIERVTARLGKPPRAVTADRGYGETGVETTLTNLGVQTVALPTKGRPSAARRTVEKRPGFQRLVKWRTGSEGRISCLKRDFGWNRTRIDSLDGAKTWCGHGVFNHNLVKIAALTIPTA